MCARYQNLNRHQSDTIDTNLLDSHSCYFPFFFGGVVGFGMHCSAVKYMFYCKCCFFSQVRPFFGRP